MLVGLVDLQEILIAELLTADVTESFSSKDTHTSEDVAGDLAIRRHETHPT